MNRKRIYTLFAFILILLLTAIAPVAAQDTIPPDGTLTSLLPIVALIALIIGLLGVIWLAHEALQHAGVNISPEAIQAIATPLIEPLRELIAEARQQAQQTTTPIDDALVNLGTYPVEIILKELEKRGIIVKYVEGTATDVIAEGVNQPSPLSS